MSLPYKVVFDAADPHRSAAFWAAALGYEVEDNSTLIRGLLDAGALPAEATTTVDGRLSFREVVAIRKPDDPVDQRTGMGQGDRLLFQAVPEPKSAKNRVHLDLHVGPDRLDAEVARLEALGASVLREVDDRGSHHFTMADPEGSEFCVQ